MQRDWQEPKNRQNPLPSRVALWGSVQTMLAQLEKSLEIFSDRREYVLESSICRPGRLPKMWVDSECASHDGCAAPPRDASRSRSRWDRSRCFLYRCDASQCMGDLDHENGHRDCSNHQQSDPERLLPTTPC